MFNINRSLKKGVRYPDKELLGDYHGLHFADLISTPAVRAMSGIDNTIELGDSGYWYMITFDLRQRVDDLMNELLEKDPAPDKMADGMAWTRHMNQIKAQAEELVIQEIIYS